jgi:hypothetical protein
MPKRTRLLEKNYSELKVEELLDNLRRSYPRQRSYLVIRGELPETHEAIRKTC